jgi:predicted metalloprotease with PDZ domain
MKISDCILTFLTLLISSTMLTAQQNIYKYKINLNEVNEDQLKVELKVPSCVPAEEVYFHFPRIVPGTYQIHDYGQVVKDLKAFDNKGNLLYVDRIDESTWRITKAKKLDKLVYVVDDTWDTKLKEPIFEAAGTSFDEGKSFILNAQGLFGYFKNKENISFELTIERPVNFYGATSLKRTESDNNTDHFKVNTYHELIDAPILYCQPDTINFKLGYGDIQLSVYSPNKMVNAKDLKEKIIPMLEAQNKYLGNILPVDRYNFLVYLSPKGFPSGSRNALEHNHSSMYCLDEESIDNISSIVIELATHEFFHIVTPLHIKSEEIGNFDYQEPKMSRHLWLYEGVVEYMAFHMQVRNGLMTEQQMLDKFSQKLRTSRFYKQGISLTEMSSNCLIEPYTAQFNNVYNRGALTAMCLDLRLMQLSGGRYDLQYLLRDLSSHFGQDQSFKDDELYEKIIEVSRQKDLLMFFSKYIEGADIINYNEFLYPFGVLYLDTASVPEISPLGGIENGALRTDSLGRMYIHKIEKLDEFGLKYILFQQGDVILEWSGKSLDKNNISTILSAYTQNVKENDELQIKILRKNAKGGYEPKTLRTKIIKIMLPQKDVFTIVEKLTVDQLKMKKYWLEGPVQN